MTDWRFWSAGRLLEVERGEQGRLTLRICRDDAEPPAPPASAFDVEFRRRIAAAGKDNPVAERLHRAKRDLDNATRRRAEFLAAKMAPLEAERADVVGRAPRGWARRVAEIDVALEAIRPEAAKLDREVSLLAQASDEAFDAYERWLTVTCDTCARAVYDDLRRQVDAMKPDVAAGMGKALEPLLALLSALQSAAGYVTERRNTLVSLALEVLSA